ncbi:MMPL domain protein [Rhodopirellula sp. SWK7]|nr:MMPL domain protein [Rhodopirellula sp. SWK7]
MTSHAKIILIGWVLLAVVAKTMAPSWKSVALDGDFDYLPSTRISVAGGRLLDRAFKGTRSRSQMVVALARDSDQWTRQDRLLGLDILRRLYHRLGEVCWMRSEEIACGEVDDSKIILPHPDTRPDAEAGPDGNLNQDADSNADPDVIAATSTDDVATEFTVSTNSIESGVLPDENERFKRQSSQRWLGVAVEAFDQAIEIDAEFYQLLDDRVPQREPTAYEPRLAIAYWDRGQLALARCADPDLIEQDLESARVLDPNVMEAALPILERDLDAWTVLLDVYSWKESVIGGQLRKPRSRIAVLTLASELAATGNIALLEQLQEIVDRCVEYQSEYLTPEERGQARDLKVKITGSAAIGGETLLAARSAITYTEWFTVGMILIILAVVYRAPLLVAVPLVSIAVAVMVATAVVTMLTWLAGSVDWLGLDLKVYTTSRIFVVVILFGAGTDYCLFLISRLREEAANHPWPVACERALANVSGALLGSALTTIVGLGMLWFADFGKFHHTGPIIAICLCVGLLVCMTMTPACLRLIGPKVFWPIPIVEESERPVVALLSNRDINSGESGTGSLSTKGGLSTKGSLMSGSRMWNATAIALTRYPAWTLTAGWLLLILPAAGGFYHEQDVTYDLSGQLHHSAGSRQGMHLLDRNFGVGELAPISILALAETDQSDEAIATTSDKLIRRLYKLDGVRRVRSLSDPLGDFPPEREMGLLSKEAWRRRTLQNHRLARLHFVANEPTYTQRLIRLDAIVQEDPFSQNAAAKLKLVSSEIEKVLDQVQAQTGTHWQLFTTGTTASIVDLREVTLRDTRRIKIAVILAVLAVLIVVIRRLALSLYLIATVLLSYYATLGLTYWFFRAIDGPEFLGLDWKLPLFLFVILVAVGQDYNVYLVTRIMEERKRLGSLAAVRRAVARTGGIVTACGIVMAATFFSMTSSAWWPPLVELLWPSSDPVAATQQTTLRGITELGFALALGVLIDTLYVRTVLVPSFVVLWDQFRKRVKTNRAPT